MSKQKSVEPDEEADRKKQEFQQSAALIGRAVVTALGRPTDFFRVSVIRLWENNYRVNVLTGLEPTSLRIADSFFVTADEKGNVVGSTPVLARRY